MRLSWNEIRVRAASLARKWADAGYEKGDTQSFYNDFFRIFGVRRESVARHEERVEKLDDTSRFPLEERHEPSGAAARRVGSGWAQVDAPDFAEAAEKVTTIHAAG